jgi:phosphate transport system substrate-binding protein
MAAEWPEVQAFVEFYLENAPHLASEVGNVPLLDAVHALGLQRFEDRASGSVFASAQPGMPIEEVVAR